MVVDDMTVDDMAVDDMAVNNMAVGDETLPRYSAVLQSVIQLP